MMDFLSGIHVPAETLWTGAVAIVVALLGSGVIVALVNRKKLVADAGLTDAQRQKLQDEIADGLRKDLLDADHGCNERIKLLEAARRLDRQECDAKLLAMEREIQAANERTARLEQRVADLTELLEEREREMRQMVESMERGA